MTRVFFGCGGREGGVIERLEVLDADYVMRSMTYSA